MKKGITLVVLLVVLGISSISAQQKFERGYFIDNENNKTECYIENADWINTPSIFKYKLSMEDKILTGDLSTVKSFAIDSLFAFHRYTVRIDKSSNNKNNLSEVRGPIYEEELVYLNLLISGSYNLYVYEESDFKRFFIQIPGETPEQLVYKKYKKTQIDIAVNELYKGQLRVYFQNAEKVNSQIDKTDYTENGLVKIFESYENEQGVDYQIIATKEKKEIPITLNVKAGVSISNLDVFCHSVTANSGFEDTGILGTRVGAELEFFLPRRNNKWVFNVEVMGIFERGQYTYITRYHMYLVDYRLNLLRVPIGFKRYFYMTENSKFYLDCGFSVGVPISSGLEFDRPFLINWDPDEYISDLPFSFASPSIYFGCGYKYKDLGLAFRYAGVNQHLVNHINYFTVKYNNISFVATYSFDFFKEK